MSSKPSAVVLFLFLLTACGIQKEERHIMATSQDMAPEIAESLGTLLSSAESDTLLLIDSLPLPCFRYFHPLYADYRAQWFEQDRLNTNGDSLLKLLGDALYYGLEPHSYHYEHIRFLLGNIRKGNIINVSALTKADLLLSDACFLLGAHLYAGRFVPDSLQTDLRAQHFKTGWDSVIRRGITQHRLRATFDSLEPPHAAYQQLKKALRNILRDSTRFAYDSIPVVSPDSIARPFILRRLMKEGYYDTTQMTKDNDSLRFAKAVSQFQKAWRIQPDGKLGKYTRQALAYNRGKIVQQLCMAMERWRWEARQLPATYALINIPAFELKVIDADTLALWSKVVCGKPETPSPVLSSKINQMLIYPYWNVPFSIAWKEILPAVQKDTSYLRRKNFEVIGKGGVVVDPATVRWKKYSKDYLPYTFRQRIGEENSLGIVKFNFNNPYGVYLHDTNSKRYFSTSSRAQSHGCIRLENYTALANFLIRKDSLHYTSDSLQLYFHTPVQRKIVVKPPLPIYIRYYTCEADNNGLRIYLDVYRKDEAMAKLIAH